MKVRVPGVRELRNMIQRRNSLLAVTQVTRQGITTKGFVESSYSARYSGWDDEKAWLSQEWKADKLMDDRTGTPVVCYRARTHEFQSRLSREYKHVIFEEEKITIERVNPLFALNEEQGHSNSSLETTKQNWNLSSGSRWFLDRVNDQVLKRQKRSSMNVTEGGETHSVIWNVHDCNNGINSIHGKELPEQWSIHCKHDTSHT